MTHTHTHTHTPRKTHILVIINNLVGEEIFYRIKHTHTHTLANTFSILSVALFFMFCLYCVINKKLVKRKTERERGRERD